MHLIANIMVDLNFESRTFVLHVVGRFADSVNISFSHVGIEHASVEFRILNAGFICIQYKKFGST